MTTKRILLGWELGAGVGYARDLVSVAEGLAARGHEPVLALRSVEAAAAAPSGFPELPVLQAPYVVGRLSAAAERDGFRPTSFADLMACNGFGDQEHLLPLVRAWRELIDLVRPDLIVGCYCPLLTLAVFERVPALVFGAPYVTPPVDEPWFPAFLPEVEPYAEQQRLLDNVHAVQRRLGAPAVRTLTDAYRGEHRLITAVPEVDLYAPRRSDRHVGIFDSWPDATPADPASGWYAYLAGDGPRARHTAVALAGTARPGAMYARDAHVADWGLPATGSVTVLRAAPALHDSVTAANVVVHHAGMGTTQAALVAGRPQLLVPQVFDQWFAARALAKLPFIRVLTDEITESTVALALQQLETDEARHAALEHAGSIRVRGLHGGRAAILDTCLDMLE